MVGSALIYLIATFRRPYYTVIVAVHTDLAAYAMRPLDFRAMPYCEPLVTISKLYRSQKKSHLGDTTANDSYSL